MRWKWPGMCHFLSLVKKKNLLTIEEEHNVFLEQIETCSRCQEKYSYFHPSHSCQGSSLSSCDAQSRSALLPACPQRNVPEKRSGLVRQLVSGSAFPGEMHMW